MTIKTLTIFTGLGVELIICQKIYFFKLDRCLIQTPLGFISELMSGTFHKIELSILVTSRLIDSCNVNNV